MPPEPPLRFAARSRGIPAPPAARRPRPPPPVSECVSALRRAVAAISPGAPSAVDAAAARAYAAAAAAGEEGVALALGAPAAADRRVQAVARCAAALRTAAMDRAGYGVDLGTVGEACAWNEEAAREFDGRRDGRAPSSAAAPAGDAGGASRSGVADGGGGGAASWGAAAAVSGGAGAGGGGGSSAALDSGVSPSWLRLRCEALAVVSGGGGGGDADGEDSLLPKLGGSAMDELQKAFPGVALQGDTMIGGRDRVGLPAGATRTVGKGFEEVLVPSPRAAASGRPPKLVNVPEALADHPELLTAMEGVSTLNRLQSAVYPAAFRSSENLLVCAPTGAGKTNVALLTILREIAAVKRRRQADFKVVYVAPMKALAAEVVDKFGARLRPLGLRVREFTGDMSLTRKETLETHVLVTTPEKWDVVTRKGGSDLSGAVTLFIIDEIHLLHDDRGAVLESIVARTLRLSEAAQRVIRLVGLSATLPNFGDVASFMRVNAAKGLFHFDGSHRPVPLSQTFVGVTEGGTSSSMEARRRRDAKMLEIAWSKVSDALKRGHQAMIFVHSRKATGTTARSIAETASKEELQGLLLGGRAGDANAGEPVAHVLPSWAATEVAKSRTGDIRELCSKGVGIHHAGLPRTDRKLVERLFGEGAIRLLCCTATLAWGVNLPARAVVILGTDVYDAQKGAFVQLGMLDVMQIFGRAGRPQFDTEGEGTIITRHENLARYLNLLTSSIPIESTLGASASVLADHLNAEIVSGTVSSVGDGVTWLSYTYLSVRMAQNPLVYGVGWDEVAADPGLHSRRATLIEQASRALDDARMCRYDPRTGSLAPTDLGRVSSHFYVSHRTVVLWNELLAKLADGANGTTDEAWEEMDATVLHAVSCASEFEQMRARQEESDELDALARDACCVRLKASPDSREGKVNILLQSYISRAVVHLSDLSYVVQSSTRLLRALFEVALRRGLPSLTLSALELARASESRVWPFRHPLWQFCPGPGVKAGSALLQAEVVSRLESAGPAGEMQSVRDMDKEALTDLLRSPRYALSVQRAAAAVPTLAIVEASVVPITRTVLSVRVTLLPTFRWKDAIHGNAESWWLWVEDDEHERIYHSERILLAKRQVLALLQASEEADPDDPSAARGLTLDLTVPVFDPPSAQYFVRVESERWHTGGGSTAALSLHNLPLPQREPPHSELLNLRPLQVAAVLKPAYARLYTSAFTHLNPVQTQVFHAAYHTDENMLIGAPTGSGKTVMAEFAILRAFDTAPGKCVVYIAPMKALVRERMDDWRRRLSGALGKTVVELTGDAGKVDPRLVDRADVIVATPEKWDVVSRGWRRRSFVRNVSLIVLDEVHLLGADRGPVLEVIVSRARRLSLGFRQVSDGGGAPEGAPLEPDVRIVALSTALSNARELADWLGVSPSVGLFNFRPSVRPVPCEVHVIGVAGERYGPRMQAMNRPAYTSILRHSPAKPVLLFVSSRRQTRLTALDLVRLAAADGRPQRFVRDTSGGRSQITDAVARVSDDALRQALVHGVGIHHAGLADADRALAERLFADGAIQVLVSTATLAWGVNLPAHLVVVKGTEFFDAKQQRYVDMPVTDILQMMGRAGRPQFDTQAFAVILVHEPKKTFLKKFLYEPFPVESSLHKQLAPHLNAEIAAGTVASPQDAMDYLTWTYFFRRMLMNPCFYGVSRGGGPPAAEAARGPRRASQPTSGDITRACSALVRSCISRLAAAGCITVTVNAGVDSAAPNGPPSAPASGASTRLLNKDAVVDSSFAGPHGGADGILLAPTSLGQVATHYYLSIKSVALIHQRLRPGMTPEDVLSLVTLCEEFAELPVRHNEGDVNAQYAGAVAERLVAIGAFESSKEALRAAGLSSGLDVPSSKARLLLFGHMARVPPPVVDYVTDLKSVADQAGRVLQAVVDIAAEAGSLSTVQSCVRLAQMLYQARIPSKKAGCLQSLATDWTATCDAAACKAGIRTVADAVERSAELASLLTAGGVDDNVATAASKAASGTPTVRVTASLDSSAGTVSVALVPGAGRRSQQRDGRGGGREWAATSATGGRGREEGWVVLVSVKGSDRLLALKRLPRIPHSGRTCVVPLPHDRSAGPASPPPCLVTAMCDAFIGIDVTVDVSDD
jgi:activating signal cointegrator complex subunit 3